MVDRIAGKLSKIVTVLDANDIDTLDRIQGLESLNTDPNKKFFYCTELVVRIIRDWCSEKKIMLPDFLQQEGISKQEASEIYPQELFKWIEKKDKKYILETIQI